MKKFDVSRLFCSNVIEEKLLGGQVIKYLCNDIEAQNLNCTHRKQWQSPPSKARQRQLTSWLLCLKKEKLNNVNST